MSKLTQLPETKYRSLGRGGPGRPKKDPAQQSIALSLWKNGHGKTYIVNFLKGYFGVDGASEGTVKKWINGFKEYQKRSIKYPFDEDDPMDIAHMDLVGLKPDSYSYVMAMDRHISNYSQPAGLGSSLTLRQAKWCWYVHSAEESLSLLDVYFFASLIAIREQQVERFGEGRLNTLDVTNFLKYQPWQSAEKQERYITLVESGKLPKLSMSDDALGWYAYMEKNVGTPVSVTILKGALKAFPDIYYELPTTRLSLLAHRLKEERRSLQT
jgi:hypothetical protein